MIRGINPHRLIDVGDKSTCAQGERGLSTRQPPSVRGKNTRLGAPFISNSNQPCGPCGLIASRGRAYTCCMSGIHDIGAERDGISTCSAQSAANQSTATLQGLSVTALLPIMGVVFVAFFVIGMALPVLPLHVHQGLGLSTFVVGLVTGSQFAASLVSRVWAGRYADARGAKRAVIVGLLTAVLSGLLYLLSLAFAATPEISVGILLVRPRAARRGRELHHYRRGQLGLALAGPANAGRVIAWIGMAMFAALAPGAPVGARLHAQAALSRLRPQRRLCRSLRCCSSRRFAPVPLQRGARAGLAKVLGAVWMPGLGSAFSSIGFGAMIAFSSLLSVERGWSPVWLTFSAFAVALVVARLPSDICRTVSAERRSLWFP